MIKIPTFAENEVIMEYRSLFLQCGLGMLALLSSATAFGQELPADSAVVSSAEYHRPPDMDGIRNRLYSPLFSEDALDMTGALSASAKESLVKQLNNENLRLQSQFMERLRYDTRYVYPGLRWQSGALTPYGQINELPGIMRSERVGFAFMQNVGNVTFGLSAYNVNYGMFREMASQKGISASLEWRLNEHLSLHGFGTYAGRMNSLNGPGFFGNPVNRAGYVDASRYGGFLRYTPNDKWGVDMGAQNQYNMATGRWEAAPILRPFVKVNGKDAIGIDVGGILYHLLRENVGRKMGWGRGNPTMGPPIPMGPPPVR